MVVVRAQSPLPDDLNPRVDSAVYSMAVQADGKILIGGGFSKLGGQSHDCLGRLKVDGTLDDSFNPGVGGDDPYVCSLVLAACRT